MTPALSTSRSLLQAGADPDVTLSKDVGPPTIRVSRVPNTRRQPEGHLWYDRRIQGPTPGPRVVQVKLEDLIKELFGPERCAFIMNAVPHKKSTVWETIAAVLSRS